MKHCRACDVDVATPAVLCPLCGTPLAGLADADCAAVYPPAGSRKEYNFVKRLLLWLAVAGAAACIVVNLLVMPSFWGVSFVVPAFICAGIVAVVVLVMCNRTNWAGYVLYQAVLAVFGLAMPVLYFTGLAHSLVGAVVPSILAVATLAGMAVFGDRTIKNEFRRRLHF